MSLNQIPRDKNGKPLNLGQWVQGEISLNGKSPLKSSFSDEPRTSFFFALKYFYDKIKIKARLKAMEVVEFALLNVVVGEIADGRAHIYDSEKKGPYWRRLSVLKKKWYGNKPNGWVIETRRGNSRK